jgi:hypothetical protein
VSVALADHDDGLAWTGHPRDADSPQASGTTGAGGGCIGCCDAALQRGLGQALYTDPSRQPSVDFLKEEVAEICGALALGASLLRRLGLGAEASRLEALFGAVENRLTETQRQSAAAPSGSVVPAFLPSASASGS